jgi:hypothetical protein
VKLADEFLPPLTEDFATCSKRGVILLPKSLRSVVARNDQDKLRFMLCKLLEHAPNIAGISPDDCTVIGQLQTAKEDRRFGSKKTARPE